MVNLEEDRCEDSPLSEVQGKQGTDVVDERVEGLKGSFGPVIEMK
jgi:hypothetical protein